jgi:tRNA pseudouridine55 synthase
MGRRGGDEGPQGLIVIDKEPGWTSHDVVAKLRGLLGQRRTGHAGTLDPSATGVLLVGLGRSTRLLRFLGETTKRYEGELALGATTTTLDADGEITARFDMSGVGLADLLATATTLTGEIEQVPPMVSAVKIDGVRLHELARRGVEVERSARSVRVDRFELEPSALPDRYRFTVECSSGTYIRSLVDDLGRLLGGGAHLTELRRTAVGDFGLVDAHRLEEVAERSAGAPRDADWQGLVLSPAEAMRGLSSLTVDAEGVARVATGRWLEAPQEQGPGPIAVLDASGSLLAVYELGPSGRLLASVVLLGA